MDRQTAIDRITETENLTDGLEDDDANWLLDWGIAHVDGLVTGIKDEDAAGEKLNQLMSVMRTLNQVASDRAAKSPDALAGDIRTFLERCQQAFGAPKDETAPTTPPTAPSSPTPPLAPTPASATPSANTTDAGADQVNQAPDQVAQAASKIAGMAPKEAMQYLLSLAEAGAPAA